MQRKICPICDHVMKSSHYCRFCKQWISNPHIVNATYYLNECHRDHEINETRGTEKRFEPDLYEKQVPNVLKTSWEEQRKRLAAEKRAQNDAAGRVFRIIFMIIGIMIFFNIFMPLLFFAL